MAANIVGGRDDQRRGVTQRPGDVGVRERLAPTVADGKIEPFAGQRDQPVGHLKLQMQLGMLMQKRRDRRDQLLATTAADIRALAPRIRAVMADDNVCVMGSEAKIREAKDLFTSLISLPD